MPRRKSQRWMWKIFGARTNMIIQKSAQNGMYTITFTIFPKKTKDFISEKLIIPGSARSWWQINGWKNIKNMHNTKIIGIIKKGTYAFHKSVRPFFNKRVSLFGKRGVPTLILHFCLPQQPIAAKGEDYA